MALTERTALVVFAAALMLLPLLMFFAPLIEN